MSSKKPNLLSADEYQAQRAALEAQAVEITNAKQGAARERDRLKYKKEPTKDIDAEIKSYDATLADIASSLRGLAIEFADSTQSARQQALADTVDAIAALAEQRTAAAKAIDAALKALGTALEAHHVAGLAAKETVLSAAALIGQDVASLLPLTDRATGSTGTLCSALYSTIYADPRLRTVVEFIGFSNTHGDLVRVTQDELAHLTATVERWTLAGEATATGKKVRVIATEAGHDGEYLREAGDEFEVDADSPSLKGSGWFVEVGKAPAPKVRDPKARPPGAGPAKGSRVGVE